MNLFQSLSSFLISLMVVGFTGDLRGQERSPNQESPEAKRYEDHLYQAFTKQMEVFSSPQEWNRKLKESKVESYVVQKKDTLWDISRILFGEGFYWPQIWASNPRLTNPHQIQPSDEIKFLLGGASHAPQFMIAKGLSGQIEIPPPERIYPPVLKNLPLSLPGDQLDADESYDRLGFSLETKPAPTYRATMQIESYYAEVFPETVGQVVEMGEERLSANLYDSLYVKMRGAARVGSYYTIIQKEARTLKSKNQYEDKEIKGMVVKFLAEVRLAQLVNPKKGIYRVEVTKIISPIEKDGLLVASRIPESVINRKGRRSRVKAQVVGGRFQRDREVMGMGATVYLNVGRNSGLRKGDIVSIVANDKKRKEQTLIELGHRLIGEAKIVKVEDNVSTAVLVNSSSEISQGDVTL